MGVTNGNAAFQRMSEDLLNAVRDFADPFVDDIIIASRRPDMSEDLLEGTSQARWAKPAYAPCTKNALFVQHSVPCPQQKPQVGLLLWVGSSTQRERISRTQTGAPGA